MRRRVVAATVARLGTIDPEGRPNLVPFVFVLDGDVVYSEVDDKPKRSKRLARLSNIERDPRVTVLVDHYEDAWERLWWVRLRGTARILPPHDVEASRARTLLADKYPQYGGSPPEGTVIAIDVEDWLGWAYTD
jgi:PPOX class probable F420-dependent enzyme